VTLQLVWSYTNSRLFSTNIRGAQRLPNGNTLVTAGAGGRVFEVTGEGANQVAVVPSYTSKVCATSVARTAQPARIRLCNLTGEVQ
jgi:hypothetical protein